MTVRVASAPPGPAERVAVSTLRRDPLAVLCELTARYGDVVCHRSGENVVVTLSRGDEVQQVPRDPERRYVTRGMPDDRMLSPLLGRGLLATVTLRG